MADRTRDTWTCPRCGSPRWVSASLNEGLTRIPQCVPCGHYDASVLITSVGQIIPAVDDADV